MEARSKVKKYGIKILKKKTINKCCKDQKK